MRKQIKLAAVASAAALLAIGASMTAFAAAGWVEEDGVWYYYDSDSNRVEDEWKKSGDNWYWLDSEEDGAMATDKLIEDDDNTYYVDTNGVMVTNTWVMVVNEDQDDDDDPAEYNYYYMGSNGKAYKQTGDSISKKTINGKTYAFDEDGKMLYGWVSKDGELQNGEDDWYVDGNDTTMYYFGSWEDGSMKTGWQKIYVHDPEKDDDYEYWFNFKSNGTRRYHSSEESTWKSNGKYYHFTPQGVMVYEWFEMASDYDVASTDAWRYFSSPEDGAEMVKGWFKVVPPTDDNSFFEETDTFATSDSDDESERWYYAKDKGVLAEGEIRKIKGKYYGFFPDGSTKAARMLTGLCALRTNGSEIIEVIANDMDSDDLDDFMDEMVGESGIYDDGEAIYLYYFGADSDQDYDGAMKTGNVNINLDGDNYSFYFKKSGGAESRGRSIAGIDDGYVYKFGQKIKADSDEKYIAVIATADSGTDGAKVVDLDSSDIRNLRVPYLPLEKGTGYDKKDDETITYITGFTLDTFLVNTSGKIQTGKKSGTKDADDWYWYLKKGNDSVGSGNICVYANSKNFKNMEWGNGTIGSDWETIFAPAEDSYSTLYYEDNE